VLLDLGMPGVNGIETCQRMRSLPGGDSLCVVAVTGWGQEEDRRRTRDAGFDAHPVKPVAPNALLGVV
jgi:CheY-like chemotaxis protein